MPAGLEPVDDRTDADLRRQLERRTSEVAALRAEVAALSAQLAGGQTVVSEWRAKAAEYDALMATKTMHAVRIPRAIYGRILARRAQG